MELKGVVLADSVDVGASVRTNVRPSRIVRLRTTERQYLEALIFAHICMLIKNVCEPISIQIVSVLDSFQGQISIQIVSVLDSFQG